jgi:hypothetical protein
MGALKRGARRMVQLHNERNEERQGRTVCGLENGIAFGDQHRAVPGAPRGRHMKNFEIKYIHSLVMEPAESWPAGRLHLTEQVGAASIERAFGQLLQ